LLVGGGALSRRIREPRGQRGGDGLPADGVAFFVELDQASVGVEVIEA
jgi:hypothetical protein